MKKPRPSMLKTVDQGGGRDALFCVKACIRLTSSRQQSLEILFSRFPQCLILSFHSASSYYYSVANLMGKAKKKVHTIR